MSARLKAVVALATTCGLLVGSARAQEDAPPAPPDVARPALMVKGAAQARLLDLQQNGSRLLAVGEEGVIVSSVDGRPWQQLASPVSEMLTRAYFLDAQRGWIVGYDGVILHSEDGGKSWVLQHRDPEAKPLYDILFLDAQRGFAVGGYGNFYSTQDGGKSWTAVSNALTEVGQHFTRLLRLDEKLLFIVGERGMVARSRDAGETWEMLRSPYSGSLFGALPLGGHKVLAFGMRGNVFVIDDVDKLLPQDPTQFDAYTMSNLEDPAQLAALGWRRIDSPIKESFFGSAPLGDGSFLLVGTNAVALRLDAALTQLTPVKLPAAETLVDILPRGRDGLLAVGRKGIQNLGALP